MKFISNGRTLFVIMLIAATIAGIQWTLGLFDNLGIDGIHVAISLNQKALKLTDDPDAWRMFIFRGIRSPKLVNSALSADKLLNDSVNRDSTNDAVWHNRAWMQLVIGNRELAFQFLHRAEQLSPGDYVYLISEALFARLQGDHDGCVRALAGAIEIEPSVADSQVVRSIGNLDAGLVNASERAALAQLQIQNDSPVGRAKIARILYSLGMPSRSRVLLESALGEYPGMINAWRLLELIQSDSGEKTAAQRTAFRVASLQEPFERVDSKNSLESGPPPASLTIRNARFFYRYKSYSKSAEALVPRWLEGSLETEPMFSTNR